MDCVGHYGHIELPAPVFHPLYVSTMFSLLRGSCRYCHHFLMPRGNVIAFVAKLLLLERGLVEASQQVDVLLVQRLMRKQDVEVKHGDDGTTEEVDDGTNGKESGLKNLDPESTRELRTRLMKWVDQNTRYHRAHKRGDYKPIMANEERKRVIADFLRSISKRKCPNCQACACFP
jgi:DNA-directed RNA polymerase beta' subunit